MAALGLHCCAQAFSSCWERGLPFVAALRFPSAVASLAVEHRRCGAQAAAGVSRAPERSSCSARTQWLRGMCSLLQPGTKPTFPALAVRFLTAGPPGNSPSLAYSNGGGNGTPLQCSCLENPMDGGAWWAAVHGVARSRARLSDFSFTFHFHALEKEMATHSSVLAWRIPGMGEPGGLPSMGLRRVGHD